MNIISVVKKDPLLYIALAVVIIYAYMKFFRTEGMSKGKMKRITERIKENKKEIKELQLKRKKRNISKKEQNDLNRDINSKLKEGGALVDELRNSEDSEKGTLDKTVDKVKDMLGLKQSVDDTAQMEVTETDSRGRASRLKIEFGGMDLNCSLKNNTASCTWGRGTGNSGAYRNADGDTHGRRRHARPGG